MTMFVVLVVVLVVGFGLIAALASRPKASLTIRGGQVDLIDGSLPPGLERDLPEILNRLIPPSREYGHERTWHDGNGHSHLQATTLGPDLTVPVAGGELVLGSWQQIFHLECDNKPHERELVVTVIGSPAPG